MMYETLLRLWKANKLSEAALTNAVTKAWITEEEKNTILATPKES